jgi:hypothetical protein
MSAPLDAKVRKNLPLWRGFLRYFPDASLAVAKLSLIGNEQHNPGEELHWARGKSMDQYDCLARHLLDADLLDSDLVPHAVKVAWRAMAGLQTYLEQNPWDTSVEECLAAAKKGND